MDHRCRSLLQNFLACLTVLGFIVRFRLVAGGMFGTKDWRGVQKNVGPMAAAPICETGISAEPNKESAVDEGLLRDALKSTLSLIPKGSQVAVICGPDMDSCDSSSLIEGSDVIALSCLDLPEELGSESDGTDHMFKCQYDLQRTLNSFAADKGKKIDAIALDSSANHPTVRVFNHMLKKSKKWLNSADLKVISLIDDSSSDWRRAFVDAIRTDVVVVEPVFRSEVWFNETNDASSARSFGAAFTVAGDLDFLPKLIDAVELIEKSTKYTGTIENIRGGEFIFQVRSRRMN